MTLHGDQPSGLGWVIGGAAALIIGAVALSGLVDRRVKSSRERVLGERLVLENQMELDRLSAMVERGKIELGDAVSLRSGDERMMIEARARLDVGLRQMESKREAIGGLDVEIAELEKRFSEYRERYERSELARVGRDARARSEDEIRRARVEAERAAQQRERVIGLESRLRILREEHRVALNHLAGGRQRSVPGSLETWDVRAQRLKKEIDVVAHELALARGGLVP